jgi:hypothetical protein
MERINTLETKGDRIRGLLQKVSHPIPDISGRAVENLCFKVSAGMFMVSDFQQFPDVIAVLVNRVEEVAVSGEFNSSVHVAVFQLLANLARDVACCRLLIKCGAVKALETIQQGDHTPNRIVRLADDTLSRILSSSSVDKIHGGSTDVKARKVKVEESAQGDFAVALRERRPLSFRNIPRKRGSCNVSHAFNEPCSLKVGWRFPPVNLVRTDEVILLDLLAQLSVNDESSRASAMEKIMFAFDDFPAEVFIERPDIFYRLISLINFPSSEVDGVELAKFVENNDVPSLAIEALILLMSRLRGSIRAHFEGGAQPVHPLVREDCSEGNRYFQYPRVSEGESGWHFDAGKSSAHLSLGYAAMVVFVSCVPCLNNPLYANSIKKLLCSVIHLLPERFPNLQPKENIAYVFHKSVDCKRVEQCLKAFECARAPVLKHLVSTGIRSMEWTESSLLDLFIIIELLELIEYDRLRLSANGRTPGSVSSEIPVVFRSLLTLAVQDEALALARPWIRERGIPLLEKLDLPALEDFLYSREVIACVETTSNFVVSISDPGCKQRSSKEWVIATVERALEGLLYWNTPPFSSHLCHASFVVSEIIRLCTFECSCSLEREGPILNESRAFQRVMNLLLTVMAFPHTEVSLKAYKQIAEALDGALNCHAPGESELQQADVTNRTLFCICLNPKFLHEVFAHGCTSTSKRKSAKMLVRKIISLSLPFPWAVRSFLPLHSHLQAFALSESVHSESEGSESHLVSSAAMTLLGLVNECDTIENKIISTTRMLLHKAKWVRKAASIELRDLCPEVSRFIHTEGFTKILDDPYPINSHCSEEMTHGVAIASADFALHDLDRFREIIQSTTSNSELWCSAATHCSSILRNPRVIESRANMKRESSASMASILEKLRLACIEKLKGTNETVQLAAGILLKNILSQGNRECAQIACEVDSLKTLCAFLYHPREDFRSFAFFSLAQICFRPSLFHPVLNRNDKQFEDISLNIERDHSDVPNFTDESARRSLVSLPKYIINDFLLKAMDVRESHSISMNSPLLKKKLSPCIQKMVGDYFLLKEKSTELNAAEAVSTDLESRLSMVCPSRQSALLFTKVETSESHAACSMAIKRISQSCISDESLLQHIGSSLEWYENSRRYLHTPPSSKKDYVVLSNVVDFVRVLIPKMASAGSVMVALTVRDHLLPELSRKNAISIESEATEYPSGAVLSVFRGNGYNMFDEECKTSFPRHDPKRSLDVSILKLIHALCCKCHNGEDVDREIVHTLIVEANLIETICLGILRSGQSCITAQRWCIRILSLLFTNTSAHRLNNMKEHAATALTSMVAIVRSHRVSNSFAGRDILRHVVICLEQLAILRCEQDMPSVWCGEDANKSSRAHFGQKILKWYRQLMQEREVQIRAIGINILGALLHTSSHLAESIVMGSHANSDIVYIGEKRLCNNLPEMIQEATRNAVDATEVVIVRCKSLELVTQYLTAGLKWKFIVDDVDSLDTKPVAIYPCLINSEAIEVFFQKSLLPSLRTTLHDAEFSAPLSLEINKLLTALDGLCCKLPAFKNDWLCSELSNLKMWKELCKTTNQRKHWTGFCRRIQNLFFCENFELSLFPIPLDLLAEFDSKQYSFQNARCAKTCIFPAKTKLDIWSVWRALEQRSSFFSNGHMMHLLRRAADRTFEHKKDRLNESPTASVNFVHLIACAKSALVSDVAFQPLSTHADCLREENVLSQESIFAIEQTVLLFTNQISRNDVPDAILLKSEAMKTSFLEVLYYLLSSRFPVRLRNSMCLLVSCILSNSIWKVLIPPCFIDSPLSRGDADVMPHDEVPRIHGIVDMITKMFLKQNSELDLGFSTKSSTSSFVSWEHFVPSSQSENVSLSYCLRALLESSNYCKHFLSEAGILGFLHQRIEEIHHVFSLSFLQSKVSGASSLTGGKDQNAHLRSQLMVYLGIYESFVYRSDEMRAAALEMGGLEILSKILRFADATEVDSLFTVRTSLMPKVLTAILNLTAGNGMNSQKSFSANKGTTQKILELAYFFAKSQKRRKDPLSLFDYMMKCAYGIIGNLAVDPSSLNLIIRSGFVDKNIQYIRAVSSPRRKIFKRPDLVMAETKNQVVVLESIVRLTRTQLGQKLVGEHQSVIQLLSACLFEDNKKRSSGETTIRFDHLSAEGLLLLRNILFLNRNKMYLTSDRALFSRILSALNDADSRISAYAAGVLWALCYNNQEAKVMVKEREAREAILRARFEAEHLEVRESISHTELYQTYKKKCLNVLIRLS